ncbi:MAG: hypothetical protein Q4G51_02155 [Dermatophilus congolensis]|nr:hypothetical protein [Dermatophilus congolensis]
MKSTDEAIASMQQAQQLLDQINNDLELFTEFEAWLADARARVQRLNDYINTEVGDDIAAVHRDDPAAVTPLVANEDSAWEALASFDLAMMRLLRIATAHLTTSLDGTSC